MVIVSLAADAEGQTTGSTNRVQRPLLPTLEKYWEDMFAESVIREVSSYEVSFVNRKQKLVLTMATYNS